MTKQDVVFLGPTGGDARFSAEWLPCWVDYDAAFYGIPAVDGRGFKIGPDRDGPPFDPTDGDRIVDPRPSARSAATSAALPRPRRRAGGRDPRLPVRVDPDTQFILDRHPGLDNVWIVGGGSGHGFKHGPVIGSYLVSGSPVPRPGSTMHASR